MSSIARQSLGSSLVALSLAVALLLPVSIEAWSPSGHMVVAAIAFRHLTDNGKKESLRLLKRNPRYSVWIAGIPAAASDEQRVKAAFINAAAWPDFIKTANGYIADGTNGGNTPPPGPSASQNIGYTDMNMHKYWHFIDRPFSDDGTPVSGPPAVNAQTEILLLRAALANQATSDDVKSYDLAWLEHLVGDVHQPLHAAQRFTASDPDGDNGGNDVKPLHCGTGVACASNLHSLWDGLLGPNSMSMTSTVSLGASLDSGPPPTGANDTDVVWWVTQSFTSAKSTAYKAPNGQRLGDPNATISAQYVTKAQALAKARARLAGLRLATLVNDAIGH